MRTPFPHLTTPTALSIDEAAHYLRMTVDLLEWFSRHDPKSDGRKLVPDVDGRYSRANLDDFNEHLWDQWPTKYVPAGIATELQREARGMCVVCRAPSDFLEQAHINRMGCERATHSQHPHNIALLCPTCHTRYDNSRGALTLATVQHAKQNALSALMESVDRDVVLQRLLTEVYDRFRTGLAGSSETLRDACNLVKAFIPDIERRARDPLGVLQVIVKELATTHPRTVVTARSILETQAQTRMGWGSPSGVRRGHCANGDGNPAILEEWRCADCGERGFVYAQPFSVNGGRVLNVFMEEDADPIECSNCESNESLKYTWSETCDACWRGR